MRRLVTIVTVFHVLGSAPVLAQNSVSSWLFPTGQELLAAARRGHDGGKQGKFKPFSLPVRSKCGKVDEAHLVVPIQAAVSLGAKKRQKFEPPPTEEEVVSLKGHLAANVVLLPDDSTTEAEVAISSGEKMYRPKQKEVYLREIQDRPCLITLGQPTPRWVVGIIYDFEFAPEEPTPTGKGKLIVRQTDGKESEIEVDFHQLARSARL